MTSLQIHETAVGPCIVCGVDSQGSNYWVGMDDDQWKVIRPHVKHLFKPNMVQKILFIPPLDKPLCGPQCALKNREKNDGKAA